MACQRGQLRPFWPSTMMAMSMTSTSKVGVAAGLYCSTTARWPRSMRNESPEAQKPPAQAAFESVPRCSRVPLLAHLRQGQPLPRLAGVVHPAQRITLHNLVECALRQIAAPAKQLVDIARQRGPDRGKV